MTTSAVILVLSTFLACAVEGVEALTVVLAVGVTRGWRSPLIAAGVATLALAALIVIFGPALSLLPIDALRLVVGTVLLIFGMGWLRKAILRASGYKALRDEAALYEREREQARTAGTEVRAGMDWYAFTLAFKGVFLEGLEVAFIVITFGATSKDTVPHSIQVATLGAVLALLAVVIAGALVHQPLSRVPENTLKFSVGLMLSAFGIFWGVEGTGVTWPGADLSILGILVFLTLASFGLVTMLRRMRERQTLTTAGAGMGMK